MEYNLKNQNIINNNLINEDILLSVIIPCFNEVKTLNELLAAVKECGVKDLEIIIVDDYSTDGTRELLKNLNDATIKVLYHDFNKGKGAALRTGFKSATGDICIVQDISGSMDGQASFVNDNGDREECGLTYHDLTTHAIKMIINTLGDTHRLSIVTFSSRSTPL